MTRSRLLGLVVVCALVAACTSGSGQPASAGPTAAAAPPSPSAAVVGVPPSSGPDPAPPSAPPAATSIAWSQVDLADGPGAREDHTWTVDPGTRTAWLFGGRDGADSFGDLWRLDLASDRWEHIEPGGSAPDARFGHTATWVEGVGLVVWSGQAGPTTFFDDLWAYDPAAGTWRELPAAGARPAARYGSCAALGPDGRLWVSHGFTEDAGQFADTWAYDFAAARWVDEVPSGDLPVARCLHDCLWTPDGRLVLYAGQTTGVAAIGDLWARGVDGGWAQGPEGEAPAARQLYAVAAVGDRAWVFGGAGEDRGRLDDLWTLDLSSLGWAAVSPQGSRPSGRSGAAFIADPEGGRLLLFGGLTDNGASAETWSLATRQ